MAIQRAQRVAVRAATRVESRGCYDTLLQIEGSWGDEVGRVRRL
jgi:hypothetical protein